MVNLQQLVSTEEINYLDSTNDWWAQFGRPVDGWELVTPRNSKQLEHAFFNESRKLAVDAGLGYYDQRLIQVYKRYGLSSPGNPKEKWHGYLTEVARNPRLLIRHFSATGSGIQRDIREKIFGLPCLYVTTEEVESPPEPENLRPWQHLDLISRDHPLLQNSAFATIVICLFEPVYINDGIKSRSKPMSFANLDVAKLTLCKTFAGIMGVYASEILHFDDAIRILRMHKRMAENAAARPVKRSYLRNSPLLAAAQTNA